jgi:hypothetical protein
MWIFVLVNEGIFKLKNVFFFTLFFENTKKFFLLFIFNHLDKMNGVSRN